MSGKDKFIILLHMLSDKSLMGTPIVLNGSLALNFSDFSSDKLITCSFCLVTFVVFLVFTGKSASLHNSESRQNRYMLLVCNPFHKAHLCSCMYLWEY